MRFVYERRLRAPSPALVISLIALFVALAGGAAAATGLISGNQIANHSISAKKLTAAAIKALHGQPDGAITIPPVEFATSVVTPLTLLPHIRGVGISFACDGTAPQIRIVLTNNEAADLLWVSGSYTADDVTTSITREQLVNFNLTATKTLNLDLVVVSGNAKSIFVSRFDLAGTFTTRAGVPGCDFWGLVTPSPPTSRRESWPVPRRRLLGEVIKRDEALPGGYLPRVSSLPRTAARSDREK